MSKLIRFADTINTCWSRVDLDSGEPIWISIANSGILIKRSRLGIFGPILFKENEVISCGDIARNLHEKVIEYTIPYKMKNIVLRSFTQTAVDSISAADLCAKISNAHN